MLFEGYTGGGTKDVIGGLMATGDVGRFDDGGRLFVEGRDDEMIVSGGENVFPKEVEDLLARHDAVAEAAAVGVDDRDFGQRLRAFVVLERGKEVSEEDLKGYVKQNLARYKVPREIVFLDELPRNATGKVLKRELKELRSWRRRPPPTRRISLRLAGSWYTANPRRGAAVSTGAVVAIVIAVLIVLALVMLLGRRGRERQRESRRGEAREIRREAEVSRAQADETRAEAEERAARARREEADARQQSRGPTSASARRRSATWRPTAVDPDVDEDDPDRGPRSPGVHRPRPGRGQRRSVEDTRARVDGSAVAHDEARGPAGSSAGPTRARSVLTADRPVTGAVAAQQQPRAPGLLPARCRDWVAAPAHHRPGAERELVHAAIGAPAADGVRVVLRLAPSDAAQLRLAPAGDLAAHLEA